MFSRTFLPATSEAGLPITMVSRHMPLVRRCVTPDETAVLVRRCHPAGRPVPGTFLLLLTNRRLVVTRESRLLHRVQLHLTAPLRALSAVKWTVDPRAGVELALTAPSGDRHRWWLPISDLRQLGWIDALLHRAFANSQSAPTTLVTTPRGSRLPGSLGPTRSTRASSPRRPALSR